ncbi:MAG: hypothetical protein IJ323_00160 [Clostridia bacterium]|nr:hypothetical protein [Clostridia bacterium]
MRKLLSLFFILLFSFLLVGCADSKEEITLYDYDFTLRVPKSAVIGDDYKAPDTSSPYYDEYHVTAKSEDDVIIVNVEGDYFEPFEVSINPDVKDVNVTSTAILKDGEEKKIIQSASTYVIGLYYAAQNGEKDIPLSSYVFSTLPDETHEKLVGYYNDIRASFSKISPDGSIISYGIYDLMFTDYFGNVTKNSDGTYTANITLSYSYIYKQQDSEDKEVFDDITLGVDMTYENGKWVVADIENPLIV